MWLIGQEDDGRGLNLCGLTFELSCPRRQRCPAGRRRIDMTEEPQGNAAVAGQLERGVRRLCGRFDALCNGLTTLELPK